jgi:hypothetical protein
MAHVLIREACNEYGIYLSIYVHINLHINLTVYLSRYTRYEVRGSTREYI